MAVSSPTKQKTLPLLKQIHEKNRRLRQIHKLGKSSLRGDGARIPRGDVDAVARKRRVSRTMLVNARRFAGQYSDEDLNDLCRNCVRHRCPLSFGHVVRLMAVPRKRRKSMQIRMIKERWSFVRLNAELKAVYGNRMVGVGRPGRRPNSVEEALVELVNMGERWGRFQVILQESGTSKTERKNGQLWGSLSEDVRKALRKAENPIARVCSTASEQLDRSR